MLIKAIHGPRGSDVRRLRRVHQWKRPMESVVDSLLAPGHLDQILRASMGMTRGLPIPIGSLPQVSVVDGMLVAVPLGGGFTSLSDLISEATNGGKAQDLIFQKTGATGAANSSSTLWFAAGMPAAGSVGAALSSGGTNTTSATTGALKQRDATGGDTLHITTAYSIPSIANNTLLLFDRIWHGAPAVSTTGEQPIASTLTRYATTGASGTSKGNFATLEIKANLGATNHSWTVTYTDDEGNAAEATGSQVGLNAGIAPRLDMVASTPWCAVLNSDDWGISDVSSFNMGASVSGATNLVVGHPLLFIPQPVAQQMVVLDGINSAFNLVRVLDGACLSFFELYKLATTATQYNGMIKLVSG